MAIETRHQVLVVDDEPSIVDAVATALRYEGFDVHEATTGRAAWPRPRTIRPTSIVLDVMLPDLDGLEVTRRLRADGIRVPVLFLTARDSVEDKVAGLTVGGDDYVTKPFSLAEIVARVRAILRRTGGDDARRRRDPALRRPRAGRGHPRGLAGRQRRSSSPPPSSTCCGSSAQPAARAVQAQILDHVWHYDFGGDANVVETYVSYLRKKLDRHGPPLIHTIRLVGYTLREPEPATAQHVAADPPAPRGRGRRPRRAGRGRRRHLLGARSFLYKRVDQTARRRRTHRSSRRRRATDAASSVSGRSRRPGTFVEIRDAARRHRRRPAIAAAHAAAQSSRRDLPTHIDRRSPADAAPASDESPRSSPSTSTRRAARSSGSGRRRWPTASQLIVAVPLDDAIGTLHQLLGIELAVTAGALAGRRALGWWLVRLGLRPLADVEADRRRPSPPATSTGGCRATTTHRGRPAGPRAQHDARPDPGRVRRTRDADRGRACAGSSPTPRTSCARRSPRSPPTPSCSTAAPASSPTTWPASWPASGPRRRGWAIWSTTSCSWPASTRDGRSSASRSSWSASRPRRSTTAARRRAGLAGAPRGAAAGRGDRATRRACARCSTTCWPTCGPTRRPAPAPTVRSARGRPRRGDRVADTVPGSARGARRASSSASTGPTRRGPAEQGGAGLGLSIVSAIVGAHGGTVAAGPDPAGGAVFTVRLPARPPTTAGATTARTTAAAVTRRRVR